MERTELPNSVNRPRGFEIVLKIRKMTFFQINPHSKPIFCKPISIWRLKHEQIYPHYIDGWVINPLESY